MGREKTAMSKILGCAAAALMLTAAPLAAGRAPPPGDPLKTTENYVEQFYPLWFTYYQSLYATTNHLVGPDRISPLYQIVVAINNDTLYASTFLDLTAEPVILTVPATKARYSVLTLDPYGDIFDSGISTTQPGTYALTGPGFDGQLPRDVTQIAMPLNHMEIIFRADKYSSTGQSQKAQAALFRRSILMQTQSNWQSDPSGGATAILPELFFAAPFKLAADAQIARQPLAFLKQLQAAVAAPNTPTLTAEQQALSDRFDKLFAAGGDQSQFAAGAQAAHGAILAKYLSHTGATGWTHFDNIGAWKPTHGGAIERSAITEFLQYGNNAETAGYYHAFRDENGTALDGGDPAGYVLNIPKNKIPEAQRFWSFTAYTPETIELVRNPARKYEIASYTSGLAYNKNGSLTLYLARLQPSGVPAANWLPVPPGPFNVMLRVYGPQGNTAGNGYVPPPIRKAQSGAR
jgi:hypothetical protein